MNQPQKCSRSGNRKGMTSYTVRSYQPGDELAQAQIGFEVSKDWIWPFAYDLEDLTAMVHRPDFDAGSRLYCLAEGKVIGYLFFDEKPAEPVPTANLEFPRVLPGHATAADRLMEHALSLAAQIAKQPAKTLRMAKRLLYAAQDRGLHEVLDLSAAFQGICHHQPEHREALEQFFARKKSR